MKKLIVWFGTFLLLFFINLFAHLIGENFEQSYNFAIQVCVIFALSDKAEKWILGCDEK